MRADITYYMLVLPTQDDLLNLHLGVIMSMRYCVTVHSMTSEDPTDANIPLQRGMKYHSISADEAFLVGTSATPC